MNLHPKRKAIVGEGWPLHSVNHRLEVMGGERVKAA